MRLLHMVHTLNPERGGPSESVRMFVLAHQRAGNEVEVATVDDPSPSEKDAAEVGKSGYESLVNCPVHPCGPGRTNYGYSPPLEHWLRRNFTRFDGVIVNGVWQYHGVVARRVLAGRKPYVVFAHGMLDPYFAKRYPLKHLKKLAYWLASEHKNLNRAQAVCFTSEEELRIAGKGFPFCNFRRAVIPYGTPGPNGDPAALKETFRAAFPALRGKRYLIFLGRIHPKKGCDLLIEAFSHAASNDLSLVMAGPDETGQRPQLEALTQRLGIADRVHWTGMLRGDAKWGAVYGAEAFVLPSHQENFGIAVADALSCGTIPLISDKVNIAADLIADGAAIVELDTLDGTLRLLERFLAMSAGERETVRARGLDSYRKRYALTNAAGELYRAMGLA